MNHNTIVLAIAYGVLRIHICVGQINVAMKYQYDYRGTQICYMNKYSSYQSIVLDTHFWTTLLPNLYIVQKVQ